MDMLNSRQSKLFDELQFAPARTSADGFDSEYCGDHPVVKFRA